MCTLSKHCEGVVVKTKISPLAIKTANILKVKMTLLAASLVKSKAGVGIDVAQQHSA